MEGQHIYWRMFSNRSIVYSPGEYTPGKQEYVFVNLGNTGSPSLISLPKTAMAGENFVMGSGVFL